MAEKQSRKALRNRLPELLAPVGSLEKLWTAVHYGADAVYLGDSRYGLRARAGKFDRDSLARAVAYAHRHGVRVYVTVNIVAHNRDLVGLEEYLLLLGRLGVDGLIISDPGIWAAARRVVPQLPLHLSTQANVTNSATARFWEDQGARRLNLARELSLEEIVEIRKAVATEIEIFVHGALCISYSGRCLLSNYLTGRDANRGNCAHPCRYSYTLVEETRPNQQYRFEEDRRGSYILNSKDLCLLRRLPELVALGADSLKIEGRMKSIYYVGAVTRVYRAALDYLGALAPFSLRQAGRDIVVPPALLEEIGRLGTRDLTENFFDGPPGPTEMLYGSSRQEQPYEPVAVVRESGSSPLVEIRNALSTGSELEYLPPGIEVLNCRVERLLDEAGRELERANPGALVRLVLRGKDCLFENHGLFRRPKTTGTTGEVPV